MPKPQNLLSLDKSFKGKGSDLKKMNEDLKVEEGPNTLVSQNSNAGDNKTPKNS